MIQIKTFETCESFLRYYVDNDGDSIFPMTLQYLNYDDMYTDDKAVIWNVAEDEGEPIAMICVRKMGIIPDSMHISVYEVNINYRGMGYGTDILYNFMKKANTTYTLFTSPDHRSFYEQLGFVYSPTEDSPNFYIREPKSLYGDFNAY
jgi:RimJ/RimL family protein N-acetyltransferase